MHSTSGMPISSAFFCAASSISWASARLSVCSISMRSRRPAERLGQVFVVEAVEIEPAHRRRLLDQTHAARLLLGRRRVLLDDLEAALAMLGIGDDVQPEEGHLVVGEAVFLDQ